MFGTRILGGKEKKFRSILNFYNFVSARLSPIDLVSLYGLLFSLLSLTAMAEHPKNSSNQNCRAMAMDEPPPVTCSAPTLLCSLRWPRSPTSPLAPRSRCKGSSTALSILLPRSSANCLCLRKQQRRASMSLTGAWPGGGKGRWQAQRASRG